MKICTKCEYDYPAPLENYFNKKRSAKDGFQHHCKKCIAIFHKEHYQVRKEYYKKKARKNDKKYRKIVQNFVFEFLSKNPCVDCGETDPIVLEFDHLRNKKKAISELFRSSLDKIKEEINKCEVRCANCHRRKTAKDFKYWKIYK